MHNITIMNCMRHLSLTVALLAAAFSLSAQSGAITPELLTAIKAGYTGTATDRALRNAIAANDINKLAVNADNRQPVNTHFSHKVESRGITNQRQSGRCWLFTGLNVLRSQMMARNNLDRLELSQGYLFFWDQLEKSNLFLQSIIDTATLPDDDRTVDWLFKNPLSDGGQWTGVSELIMKYGVVPAEVMPETNTANSTSRYNQLLSLRLREDGLQLRRMAARGAGTDSLLTAKTGMLAEVYRILVLNLGEPVTTFTWTRRDADGNAVDTRTYTPQQFYATYAGNDLRSDYIMVMNDPTRPYYRTFEIDYDRHTYDGANWTYVNLPVDDIKAMAIESIKDSTMMYFSCDVAKFLDRDRGLLDIDNYDYEALLGTKFGMDKRDRVRTHASGSSHAMTLMAVDLDSDGRPTRWMVENSWGPGANDGHLVMTDRWFDEYMFRLVVDKKYVPRNVLDLLKLEPERLPAWDPMFAPEQ